MLPLRIFTLPILALLALTGSGCEVVADFDRDKINAANAKPPSDIPMIPAVPPEMPDDSLDAGDDAGLDASPPDDELETDAGGVTDSGLDGNVGADASLDDAGDAGSDDDAGAEDAGAGSDAGEVEDAG